MDDSDGGVRISIPHDFELPDKFILRRYSGREARYKVAMGQKQTSRAKNLMSVLPPKADIRLCY